MVEWPNELVTDLARRKAAIVIGSGLSRQSLGRDGTTRPPTWKELIRNGIGELSPSHGLIDDIEGALNRGDLLHACEWLQSALDESWPTFLRTQLADPEFAPVGAHNEVLRLDARVVVSLNFDDIYERASATLGGRYITKNYYDTDAVDFLRGSGRYIVKAHGGLHSISKLIFTQEQYARARALHHLFYKALDALMMTHSILFVGCGYNDPDLSLILEGNNFSFPDAPPHYMLTTLEAESSLGRSLRKNRSLKCIRYEPTDDEHSNLCELLADLADQVEIARRDLTATLNW